MRILCLCSQGNKRSVSTRYILNHVHDTLAAGIDVNSADTIELLCQWADVILMAEPKMIMQIPANYQHKVDTMFMIGPDVYDSNRSKTLEDLITPKLKILGYIKE